MERRGAKVIGLDLDETQDPAMGLVPHWDYERKIGYSMDAALTRRRAAQRSLRNSFLYCRSALGSNVRLMTGNIMLSPIPQDVQAEGAFFGAILLHLRDPLAALYNVARNVRETIVITENLEIDDLNMDGAPNMLFRPSPNDAGNVGTWFYMYPSFLKRALEVAGFTRFTINRTLAKDDINGTMVPFFCLVARR